jgi:hypothetical protein
VPSQKISAIKTTVYVKRWRLVGIKMKNNWEIILSRAYFSVKEQIIYI